MKKLYIPNDAEDKPRIITDRKEFDKCAGETDAYCIAPNLTMLHKLQKGKFNPHFKKMGIEIEGTCLIIKENEVDEMDVDDDLLDKLGEILENDNKRRKEYHDYLINTLGVQVIDLNQ